MAKINSNSTSRFQFISKTRVLGKEIYNDAITYLSRAYGASKAVFTPASPFAQILKVLSEISELILFYIEDATVEQNILTANQTNSIYGLARLTGHNPTRAISSIGEIKVKFIPGEESNFNGSYVLIPKNTCVVCDNNGLKYTIQLKEDFVRVAKNTNSFSTFQVVQGEVESQRVIGTGKSLQSFNIASDKEVSHNDVSVSVNGEKWKIYDSLYDMPRLESGCLVKTGISGGIDIFFGNGGFGKAPSLGSTIEITYLKTSGTQGNINDAAKLTWKWDGDLFDDMNEVVDGNKLLMIQTGSSPKFGSDAEPTAFTKIIAPLQSKSFVLAAPENYEVWLSRYNSFSYIDAYNTYDDDFLDDDNVIYLFLLPDITRKLEGDRDYFTLDEDEFTLNKIEIEAIKRAISESGQQMVTTELQFVQPKIKRYALNIILRYFENYDKDNISVQIRSQLNDYFLKVKRRDKIPKSDLIALIETVEGVDSVNVFFISEENEKAVRDGFYFTEKTTVKPTTPFMQTDENNKKRFVFFNKVTRKIKNTLIKNENGEVIFDPNLGLDEFGDINIGQNELPIIRGGWDDRNGNTYEPFPVQGKASSLTIYFKEAIKETVTTKIQASNKKNLMK